MDMAANRDFETRFFDLLQKNLDDLSKTVTDGFKSVNKKVDQNTTVTNSISKRVDKLDNKVFAKKSNPLSLYLQDKQIVGYFILALLVFLLILASVLHVKVPTL